MPQVTRKLCPALLCLLYPGLWWKESSLCCQKDRGLILSYLRHFLAGPGRPPGAPHLTCLSRGWRQGSYDYVLRPGSALGMWLWHPGDPGRSAALTVAPFPAQVLAAEENVDFRIHVENQTRARDDVSRKQLRLYQLYSRTSGKHIQVLGRRISARGEDGDKYGRSQFPPPPQCTHFPASEAQVQVPALPYPGCVTLHLTLGFPGPQFPHLWRGDAAVYPREPCWEYQLRT